MSRHMKIHHVACTILVALLSFSLVSVGQESTGLREQIQALPHLPDGHELVAFVDCGGTEIFGADSGVTFNLVEGDPVAIANGSGSLSTATQHKKQVTYALTGLEPDSDYVLGVTWWDFDLQDRRQSLQIASTDSVESTTLLPSGRPLTFHKGEPTWAHVLVPLDRSLIANGKALVSVTNTSGPNAVVNTLYLLKKTTKQNRKRILIVTGDEFQGHAWQETAPEFASILRANPNLEVTITETPHVLASPVLNHYDAVFLHFKDYPDQLLVGEAEWMGLKRYVESGKGLIMTHFAIGAFEDWDGFVNLVGRVWNPEMRGHDAYGSFEILVPDNDHPITETLTDFQTIGELYTCLDGPDEIDVLCEAKSNVDHKNDPMAFTVPNSKGRVFQCTLGHDLAALKSEGTRELYRRAAAWATGLPQSDWE